MKIWTRIALAGITASLAVNAAFAQTTNANTLTDERKEEILARVTEIIQRFAYVPGVDFSRWPEILKGQKDRIASAKEYASGRDGHDPRGVCRRGNSATARQRWSSDQLRFSE
jgi:hypothetical protein